MAPFKLSLKVYQGATFTQPLVWKAGDPLQPVDLTGCTARMQIRERVNSPGVLFSLTSEVGGGIVLGGAAGTIDIEIDATDTATFNWRSGVYDLEIVYPDGKVRRLFEGSIQVAPEVTR